MARATTIEQALDPVQLACKTTLDSRSYFLHEYAVFFFVIKNGRVMIIKVESVIGPVGLHEPSAFTLGNRRVHVVTIIDRWLSSAHAYFKLSADDGAIYILRHDEYSGQWEMTLFQSASE